MSSSWLRLLVEPSDKLELAELNGCSEGHGDGGPPFRNSVAPQPMPDLRRGLYRGGPRNGTKELHVCVDQAKDFLFFLFYYLYFFILFVSGFWLHLLIFSCVCVYR